MNDRNHDAIRQTIRAAYGRVAHQDAAPTRPSAGSCCGAGSGAQQPAEGDAPAGADLGLSSGDPLTLAGLQPGETVVDLGSGAGRDSFPAARRVGPRGRVIGVDMTPEMVDKARGLAREGGFGNAEFRLGEIEHLPVMDGTADVVISNCVINLSPDKPQVLREAYRVLKPGGRLAVSDIVALQPLPESLRVDPERWPGCVVGAETVEALERWLREAGFEQIRIESAATPTPACDSSPTVGAAASPVRAASIQARKPVH